jgi:hypothetical protein
MSAAANASKIPEWIRNQPCVQRRGMSAMISVGAPWAWVPSLEVSHFGNGVSLTWGLVGLYLIPHSAGRVLTGLGLLTRFLNQR